MYVRQENSNRHGDKRNDPDWCSSLYHSSVLQSGKRLSRSSMIRLEVHFDVSTPRETRLSKIAHPRRQRQPPQPHLASLSSRTMQLQRLIFATRHCPMR